MQVPTPIEFQAWPKIARLNRDITVTEKIDGCNAAVIIAEYQFGEHVDGVPSSAAGLIFGPDDESGLPDVEYLVAAQSRKRLITPDDDNHGFARWVWDNAPALVRTLGPGRHFGEWWGSGIRRGYGLQKGEKRFSLFNTTRWGVDLAPGFDMSPVPGLRVVPVLYEGPFSQFAINETLGDLRVYGSRAVPGFTNPEGVVIYHTAANLCFKVTLENDEAPKSKVQQMLDKAVERRDQIPESHRMLGEAA